MLPEVYVCHAIFLAFEMLKKDNFIYPSNQNICNAGTQPLTLVCRRKGGFYISPLRN